MTRNREESWPVFAYMILVGPFYAFHSTRMLFVHISDWNWERKHGKQ